MKSDVLQKIRSINREFYQTFADSFADTRQRLQPGVERLLPGMLAADRILDIGCGNGVLASQLAGRDFDGCYLGVDLSEQMLSIAREHLAAPSRFAFLQAEVGVDDLRSKLTTQAAQELQPPYDHQIMFATLHHIPGNAVRAALLRDLHRLASPGGRLSISVWNFMDSQRLVDRILPWDTLGLDDQQVESGDYLIDWRRDGHGIRYVHHFSEDELAELAGQAGYLVQETFYSDGETGQLGLYQIWQAR